MILVPVAWGSATSAGARRMNQDKTFVAPPWAFILDGVGGSHHGGPAAQIGLGAALEAAALMPPRYSRPQDQEAAVREVARESHQAVMRKLSGGESGSASGSSTLAVLHFQARTESMIDLAVAQVGDSSVWVSSGPPQAVEVVGVPAASQQLLSALGWPDFVIATQRHTLRMPGRIVMMTDGARAVGSGFIRDALLASPSSPNSCAEALVSAAGKSSRDNATACVIDVGVPNSTGDYVLLPDSVPDVTYRTRLGGMT